MHDRPAHRRFLLLGIAAALIAACMTDDTLFDPTLIPPAIDKVVLTPINFDATPHRALQRGATKLERDVSGYLDQRERDVDRPPLREVLGLWGAIASKHLKSAPAEDEPPRQAAIRAAHQELAQQLAEQYEADVVVMPTLLIREGRYTGFALRWDGTTREVRVDVEAGSIMGVQRIGGKGTGTSLRIAMYRSDGVQFYRCYAGLEPTDRFVMSGFGSARGGSIQSFARSDLFRDPEILNEAVARCLGPIFPTVEPEAEAS